MKLCLRTLAISSGILTLLVGGLVYIAGDRLHSAGGEGNAALAASLDGYRHAQALKAQAAGYELTMNEFYSTVLDAPAYQKKVLQQKTAIEQELVALAGTERDGKTVAELHRIYKDMEGFRQGLESALSGADKDWDRAREALFKLNLLSIQAIQQAEVLAQVSRDQAVNLDKTWQSGLTQALTLLNLALGVVFLAAVSLALGVFRRGA